MELIGSGDTKIDVRNDSSGTWGGCEGYHAD